MGPILESLDDVVTSTIVIFVTTPCSLARVLFLAAVKAIVLVALAWLHLLISIIDFLVDLCCRAIPCALSLVTTPFRIFTALLRQKTLEMQLDEMGVQLENLARENLELPARLQMAVEDRKAVESIFQEIEDDYVKALGRIDLLEDELLGLKEENLRLKKVQQKFLSTHKALAEKADNSRGTFPLRTKSGVPPWSTGHSGKGFILQLEGDPWDDGDKGKHQNDLLDLSGSDLFPAQASEFVMVDDALEPSRFVALFRSLFSAILSLVVGTIIWEAENPCMPLVAALFIVVGMSLISVVQFFSTIRNKPASDVVALLSVNWFILGTLTTRALPSVAQVLAPFGLVVASKIVGWFGLSS